MAHICEHETDIAMMARDIKEIKALLKGNGKKGLVEEFNEFKLKATVCMVVIALGGFGSGVGFFNLLKSIIL